MLTLAIPAWHIIVRTAAVYLVVFPGLRLMGKRELGQMTVFDLVVILLIASAVQNAMVGPDESLTGGVLAATVLIVVNWAVTLVRLRIPLLDSSGNTSRPPARPDRDAFSGWLCDGLGRKPLAR